jgi:hypothetical protein
MIQQINLIDPSLRVVRDWLAGRVIAGTGLALAVVVGAHWACEQTTLTRLLSSAGAAPPSAEAAASAAAASPEDIQLRDAQRAIAGSERLMQAVAGLTDLPHDNAQRLRSVIAAMPETLWLQEVEFDGERGLRIAGGATDAAALTAFAQRLGALPAFRGVPLQVFKVDPRAAPARPDAADAPALDERAPHYAFVLSTSDMEAPR